jgi:Kef-type K+ transport system membrane component KefB
VRMLASDSPLLWWYGFPIALMLTCAIEVPAYLAAFWALGWSRSRPSLFRPLTTRTALALALAVNLISHPMLWMISLRYGRTGQLIIAETCVAVIEGLLIFVVVGLREGTESRQSRLGWSLLTALGVNTLALLVGLITLPTVINR